MTRIRISLFRLVAIVFCAASLFTNCESSATKAKEDELFAKRDRLQAERDSIADYQKFKAEAEERVVKNSHIIADFKVRIMIGKVTMKAKYQNRLTKLERQNNDMQNRLKQYSEIGTGKWEIFKRDWNRDMGRLVESLNKMTEDDK